MRIYNKYNWADWVNGRQIYFSHFKIRGGNEISTNLNYPWDRCDPMWRSGKVRERTSRSQGFNSSTCPDFFTISIQCMLVSQCFIYLFNIVIISLACIIYSDPRTHCLVFRIVLHLAKVKLISHPQIFLILYYVGLLRHQRWWWNFD